LCPLRGFTEACVGTLSRVFSAQRNVIKDKKNRFYLNVLQHKSFDNCDNDCDQREPSRSAGYEGLDATDMESLQRPPPPHHYAGLGVQASGPGLDQHGYLVVVDDPVNADYPLVSCMWKYISCAM